MSLALCEVCGRLVGCLPISANCSESSTYVFFDFSNFYPPGENTIFDFLGDRGLSLTLTRLTS
jgi:hypothetical protein